MRMDVQRLLKRITLFFIVIVIRSQRTAIRADDDDGGFGVFLGVLPGPPLVIAGESSEEVVIVAGQAAGDSSKEVVGFPMSSTGVMSSTASLLSFLGRPPRRANPQPGCIYDYEGGFCASDGRFYNSTCDIYANGLHFTGTRTLCEWCEDGEREPCSKRTPVCAGRVGNARIYENRCHLSRAWCREALQTPEKPLETISKELKIQNIGNCQEEVDVSEATCYEVLRGVCPRGTVGHRVCNTTEVYYDAKTGGLKTGKPYKNICRVLHKRCKYDDQSICYDFAGRCDRLTDPSTIEAQDCSKYILNYDVGTSARTCPDSTAGP